MNEWMNEKWYQMYVLDANQQFVRHKKLLSALYKFSSKLVYALILIECTIKKEPKELYSIERKMSKTLDRSSNGDYFFSVYKICLVESFIWCHVTRLSKITNKD